MFGAATAYGAGRFGCPSIVRQGAADAAGRRRQLSEGISDLWSVPHAQDAISLADLQLTVLG